MIAFPRLIGSALVILGTFLSDAASGDSLRVLVYSRTTGFRHDSIPAGIEAIQNLGTSHGFEVVATEDPAVFTDTQLAEYDAAIFLQTTGNPLEGENRAAFERFIQSGKGFIGVHSATDVDGSWPWYVSLIGARFANHPAIQSATIEVVDANHPSTQHLDPLWVRDDEWYNFQSVNSSIQVLLNLDESSYEGGTMGASHPIAWYHRFDGGRSWYTGGGHTTASFAEPDFLEHLAGGILWAAVRSGDYNRDGLVDAADYVVWRDSMDSSGLGLPADGDGNGIVNAADYQLWRANFMRAAPTAGGATNSVPEPAGLAHLAVGVFTVALACNWRRFARPI